MHVTTTQRKRTARVWARCCLLFNCINISLALCLYLRVCVCSRLSREDLLLNGKWRLFFVFLSTRTCRCRPSSINAWQEVSIVFQVWNDTTPRTRSSSSSGNSIIICLLTSHRLPASLLPIVFVIFSLDFDLNPCPFSRRLVQSICLYGRVRARFPGVLFSLSLAGFFQWFCSAS